ncbi:MAG: hypothetical protein JWN93_2318 [Hyphomicrobiales bacterium]|nr:hypothetical protein [Hyphomicrobiales bacterium]
MHLPMKTAALYFTLVASVAFAQRAPTDTELARIGQALSAAGFTTWGTTVLDEDAWEVEEARKGAQSCDVSIDARTYAVLEEDCE